jgi:hypothetical protein
MFTGNWQSMIPYTSSIHMLGKSAKANLTSIHDCFWLKGFQFFHMTWQSWEHIMCIPSLWCHCVPKLIPNTHHKIKTRFLIENWQNRHIYQHKKLNSHIYNTYPYQKKGWEKISKQIKSKMNKLLANFGSHQFHFLKSKQIPKFPFLVTNLFKVED